MDEINQFIADTLKAQRRKHGFSLDELAKKTGVSKSMLGGIERGVNNPTILVLWKIADGLNIPISKLIEQNEKNQIHLVRKEEQSLLNSSEHFVVENMFPYNEKHKIEIHHIEINPHGSLKSNGHKKGIEEYVLMLAGNLEISIGKDTHVLKMGDSIRFNAAVPHCFTNISSEIASFKNIMFYGNIGD